MYKIGNLILGCDDEGRRRSWSFDLCRKEIYSFHPTTTYSIYELWMSWLFIEFGVKISLIKFFYGWCWGRDQNYKRNASSLQKATNFIFDFDVQNIVDCS